MNTTKKVRLAIRTTRYLEACVIVPYGWGKLTFPGGADYDGEFEKGSIHGHGRMTLPNGEWYLGEWVDSQRNSIGLKVNSNGKLKHEGTFWNGNPLICSSFPGQKKWSAESQLLYHMSCTCLGEDGDKHLLAQNTSQTLVGPIPRSISMNGVLHFGWIIKEALNATGNCCNKGCKGSAAHCYN